MSDKEPVTLGDKAAQDQKDAANRSADALDIENDASAREAQADLKDEQQRVGGGPGSDR